MGEFEEFAKKLDLDLDKDAIKEIFDSIDSNGDGELSCEEFG